MPARWPLLPRIKTLVMLALMLPLVIHYARTHHVPNPVDAIGDAVTAAQTTH